jgi:uncharacterized protein YdeI (YjbR/CyaY-like superfamily)
MQTQSLPTLTASTTGEWRSWLAANHATATEIWLVIQHKDSGIPSPRYHEAIEQALCFGWIDSHARKHDADSSVLRFTPRNPRSTWSRVNRERVARMTELGLMTEAGQALIDLARAKGSWQLVPDSEVEAVPADLRERLDRDESARVHFDRFPPSSKRRILEWIATAKKPETRQRRIARTVELAAVNLRANHPGVRGA